MQWSRTSTLAATLLSCVSGCPEQEHRELPPAVIAAKGAPVVVKTEFWIAVSDERHAGLARVAEAIAASEEARAANVKVVSETRPTSEGGNTTLRVIVASDKAGMASALGSVLAAEPELAPSPGARLVYAEDRSSNKTSTWRVFWVDHRNEIRPGKLHSAEPAAGPGGGGVAVTLLPHDAETLGVLTKDAVGQRLILGVGDRVLSAPVVRDRITQGKLLVATGGPGRSAEQQRDEATSLIRALVGE